MDKTWKLRVDSYEGDTIGWLGSNGVSQTQDEYTYRWPSRIWDIKEHTRCKNPTTGQIESKTLVLAVVLLHRLEASLPDYIQGNLVWVSEDEELPVGNSTPT